MITREAVREYATGSLWVLPGISALVALLVGFALSQVEVDANSPFAFQGTADDARALLSNVTGTVITVIALVLGLTVVALQLSSTQFSPRLIRNFLRDDRIRWCSASLLRLSPIPRRACIRSVRSGGAGTEQFPRIAVTGSILLLFASLAMVIYFADHLAHSIQVDAIGRMWNADLAVARSLPGRVETGCTRSRRIWAIRCWPRSPGMCRLSTRNAAGHRQSPPGAGPIAHAGRRTRRCGHAAGVAVDPGPRRSGRTRPCFDFPSTPRSDRLRTHARAGCRLRHPSVGRHGVQSLVSRGERPVHGRPGDRSPLGDLHALAVRPLGDDVVADRAGAPVVSRPGEGSATTSTRCAG